MKKYRPRIYYTEADKTLMWYRWQKGESLNTIANRSRSIMSFCAKENRPRPEFVLSTSADLKSPHVEKEVRNMSNKRRVFSFFIVVFVTFFTTGTLWADQQKTKGKPEKTNSEKSMGKPGTGVDANLSVMVSAGISFGNARELAARYELTGSKPLPPGIRKNLARGKPMPPGIQKTRMPASFINQLPDHEGYEWQQAGTDLVLVVTGSLVISDILEGVFD